MASSPQSSELSLPSEMQPSRPRRSVKQVVSYIEQSDSASEDNDGDDAASNFSGSDGDNIPLDVSDPFGVFGAAPVAVEDSPFISEPSQIKLINFPTQPEIRAAKERISATSSELERIEAQYQAIKEKYEAISEKRNALIRAIDDDKEFISPIRRLPVELLGLVFLFHTALPKEDEHTKKFEAEDDSGSPWTLMHVSRTWRSTALYTRQLWSAITLTSPAYKNLGLTGRRRAGREVCGTSQQLEMALKRVGSGSIDLLISFSNPFDKKQGGWRAYDSSAFRDMFATFAISGKGLQVKHLKVRGKYGLFSDTCPVDNFNLINLETLKFDTKASSAFLNKLIDSLVDASRTTGVTKYKGSLHSMEICIAQPRWHIVGHVGATRLSFLKKLAPLRSLTHLAFDFRSQYPTPQEIEDLQVMLESATTLVHLEVISLYMDKTLPLWNQPAATNTAQRPLRLPHIHSLVLSKGSVLRQLESTSLAHLTLKGDSYIEADDPSVNARTLLPNLTSLIVDVKQKPDQYMPLKHLDLPGPLHTVDLRFGKFAERFWEFIDSPAFSGPVVLRLRKLSLVNSREIARLVDKLRGMRRLEELEVEGVTLNKQFFDQLCSGEDGNEEANGGFLLPALHSFKIDLEECALKGQDRAIKAAARKAVRRRRAEGLQMRSALLRMPEGKGWIDLLG